jgi:aspartyl/asparaginyl beta-hydroxylase (cupin superfamily)
VAEAYLRIFGDYAGGGPVFYPRAECPWLADVEREWRAVRAEFEEHYYRRGHTLRAPFIPDDVEVTGWRSVNLVTYGHWYPESCRRFPRTAALMRTIPGLTSAFINLLEPHSSLPPHNGDTNTTYRCHLGLIVPGDVERCGLAVGGERTGWREGEAFAFNEAYRHAVWNDTDHDRVLLVFDVLRPEFSDRRKRICRDVLGAIALMALETRIPALRRLPHPARRGLHRMLGPAASAALLLRDSAR